MAVALCSNGKGRQEGDQGREACFVRFAIGCSIVDLPIMEHIHKSFVLISKIYKTYFLNFLYKVSRETIPYLFVACGGCCVSNLSFSLSPPLSSSSRIRFGIWLSKSKRKEGALEREGRGLLKERERGAFPSSFFPKSHAPSPPLPSHTHKTQTMRWR